MRAKLLLVGTLALLLGACGGKGTNNHAPPPLNKQLLIGKWKSSSEFHLIPGYDFAADGALKMTVRGMDKPVPGKFTWRGDRDLALKFEAGEDVKKAYAAAAKAYKDEVRERVKKGTLPDRALASILGTVRDELPAEEKYRVGLTEQPRLLVLTDPDGTSQRLEKAD
jgi:hypothetical protein